MTTATHPTATQLADVLDKAITVIGTNSWHRGYLYDEDQYWEQGTPPANCPVCALGAINIAISGRPMLGISGTLRLEDAVALADAAAIAVAVHLKVGTTPRALARWNDEEKRVVADVVQAFRDTAAELRAEAASHA